MSIIDLLSESKFWLEDTNKYLLSSNVKVDIPKVDKPLTKLSDSNSGNNLVNWADSNNPRFNFKHSRLPDLNIEVVDKVKIRI